MRDNDAFIIIILVVGIAAVAFVVLFLAMLFGAFGYVFGAGVSSM